MGRPAETLEDIDIFRELSPEHLRSLAARCTWREYRPKQQVVGHREATRSVFFLVSGLARAAIYSSAGKRVTFRDIHAGDMFGEFAAIDGEPRSASVEAVQTSLVATMSPDVFWDVLKIYPVVMAAVLKRLTRQIRTLSDRVYEFSTLAVGNRIHAELMRLSKSSPRATGRVVIYPAPTHEDIATRVSSNRETVTRTISDLVKMGIVESGHRTLVIRDIARLRHLVKNVVES
jgi:CRP-like cAMP-binding protein